MSESSTSSTGILFVNLGSPDSYKPWDVARYLNEFLMDKYVIDVPYLLRLLIVKAFVLPFRPFKASKAYESIWWEEGSPLIEISRRFFKKIKNSFDYPSELAMRYGNPSINYGLSNLLNANPNLENLVVVPLYPHFAMSTTQTVMDKVLDELTKFNRKINTSFVDPFYKHPKYINALAESIQPYISDNVDHLLFSYHGIPVRHVKKTDMTKKHCYQVENCCDHPSQAHTTCYRHQVFETTRLTCDQLNLKNAEYSVSFQSRLGKDPWLQPYTDVTIEDLAKKGVKHLAVACPAFVADCLETLEEIQEEGEEIFQEAGGETFTLIPCLNDQSHWIDAFAEIVSETIPSHQVSTV